MVAVEAEVNGREETGPPEALTRKDDPLGKLIRDRWKKGEEELAKARRHYWQNLAFFLGEQWVWWDSTKNQLNAAPLSFMQIAPGRTRQTINRIATNIQSVLARLTASDLSFEVRPSDVSDDVVNAASLAEQVLRVEHQDRNWEAVRNDELFSTILAGTSAVALEWDPSAGEQLEVDDKGRVIGTGAASLQSLTVTEFCLEPGVREPEKARWWIMGMAMTPGQAKARYGLDWTPRSDASGLVSPMQLRILNDIGRPSSQSLVLVLSLYERPNPACPKGRYVVTINEQAVHESEWPFPFKDKLNLAVFRQTQMPANWYGWTYVNAALPIQVSYNHAMTVQSETARVTGMSKLIAPHGAFAEEDFDNDPGKILWYSPDGTGGVPQYITPPQLPRWIIQHADDLAARLDDIMFVHATSRGEASFDRASGQALSFLAEKDDTPLGPMAKEQARGWAWLASAILQLHEAKVRETRKGTIMLSGKVPMQVRWTGKHLRGQHRVQVPLDATQPHSKAADRAYADSLWDRKIIQDPALYMKLGRIDPEQANEVIDPQVARAQRENARMVQGVPELVEGFDDHAKHIAEHNAFRATDTYQFASEEVRSIFDDHCQMHETQQATEYGQQVKRAGLDPGLAKLPQAGQPIGSVMPPPWAMRQAGAVDPTTLAFQQAAGQAGQGGQGAPMQANPGTSPQSDPATMAAMQQLMASGQMPPTEGQPPPEQGMMQ